MPDFNKSSYTLPFENIHITIPLYQGQFWTEKQRASCKLHELPYMACFKPELPKFFIEKYSKEKDTVFDPFMGRGTTLIEAAMLNRNVVGNDCNPSSLIYVKTRLNPPSQDEVEEYLKTLDLSCPVMSDDPLLVFYHPKTLESIKALRDCKNSDPVIDWIKMVASTRLTGHSSGFFSVYSLPPNSQASIKAQEKINKKKQNTPPLRNVKKLIIKKSAAFLRGVSEQVKSTLKNVDQTLISNDSRSMDLDSESVNLVVTSPPFLDVVDYKNNHWLKNWFLKSENYEPSQIKSLKDWKVFIFETLLEIKRIMKDKGFLCMEVGEIKKGSINLEKEILLEGVRAGLHPICIYHHHSDFTKTSNIWGVKNMKSGTNTNRIVVFQKKDRI